MTDNNEQDDQLTSTETVETTQSLEGLGSILKQAREDKGLSADDVAERLHLRPAIIYDIDDDRLTEIGSSTYVRGYIKNYARIVDVPMSSIQANIEQQVPTMVEHNMQSFSRKTSRQARDSRLMLVTYLIAGVLFVLLLIWWVQKYSLFSGVDFSQPTVEEVAASSTPTMQQTGIPKLDNAIAEITSNKAIESGAELQLGEINAVPVVALKKVESQTLVTESIRSPSSSQNQEQVTPESQSNDQASSSADSVLAQLEMSVTGECWVKAVDDTGKVLIDGVKKAGRDILVSGKPPFKLILGAPQVVSISFNGESVDMSQFPGTRVARFSLPLVQ